MATDIERIKQCVKIIYSLSVSHAPDRQKIADAEKQLLLLLECITVKELFGTVSTPGILFFEINASNPSIKYKNVGQIIFCYCSYDVLHSVLESMEEAEAILWMSVKRSDIHKIWNSFKGDNGLVPNTIITDSIKKQEILNRMTEINEAAESMTVRPCSYSHPLLKNKYGAFVKWGSIALMLAGVGLFVIGMLLLHSGAIGAVLPLIVGSSWALNSLLLFCLNHNSKPNIPFKYMKNIMTSTETNIAVIFSSLLVMGLSAYLMLLFSPSLWIGILTIPFVCGMMGPFSLLTFNTPPEMGPDKMQNIALPTASVIAMPSMKSENDHRDNNISQAQRLALEIKQGEKPEDVELSEITEETRLLDTPRQ